MDGPIAADSAPGAVVLHAMSAATGLPNASVADAVNVAEPPGSSTTEAGATTTRSSRAAATSIASVAAAFPAAAAVSVGVPAAVSR